MLVHPQFDPIAFSLGPLAMRWYGLMYLVGFVAALWLGRRRALRDAWRGWSIRDVDDALFYVVLGVILGGRLGYVLFYKLDYYAANPLEIFYIWQGGMSFHGGLVGVIVATWLFCRRRGLAFWPVIDFAAPLVPIGLAAGRIGNFINGELWGRPTDVPWAMVFPQVDALPRHPSQLYEFGLEGLALFAILWTFGGRPRPMGAVSGLFLAGYGVARFVVEYAREPDAFLGTLAFGLSMGQWLSVPMIAAGVIMMAWAYARAGKAHPTILDRMK